ncbi:16047_t:CDS:2 [Funneliformis caledonium]|uniref:16047_t:CDS:1 n=1 Tax=Funneliformis caledonium TaxID=1117310 RepID=A0A9N9EEM5_9GLOM|nr:16047_t:CDS:2 [Funneliformis caledonium]
MSALIADKEDAYQKYFTEKILPQLYNIRPVKAVDSHMTKYLEGKVPDIFTHFKDFVTDGTVKDMSIESADDMKRKVFCLFSSPERVFLIGVTCFWSIRSYLVLLLRTIPV